MAPEMPDLNTDVVVLAKLSKEELDARSRCMQAVRSAHRSLDSAVLDYKMTHQVGSQNQFVATNLLERLSVHIDTPSSSQRPRGRGCVVPEDPDCGHHDNEDENPEHVKRNGQSEEHRQKGQCDPR